MPPLVLRRFLCLTAILLQVWLVAGCRTILSVEPLSKPSDSLPDREVNGTWWALSSDGELTPEAVILIVSAIGRDKQEGLYIEHLPGEALRSTKFYLYPTKIGARRFASIKLAPSAQSVAAENEFEGNFNFFTYTLVSDRLRIYELNFDVFERGIKSGTLKGSIEHNRIPITMTITDSTENIQRLIEENLDKIRDEKGVIEFKRVDLKPK